MKNQFLRTVMGWSLSIGRVVGASVTGMLIIFCVTAHGKQDLIIEDKDMLGVSIIGVQHLGENFNIPEFYVNGNWAGNVGKEGGGGGNVCCAMLPMKWRPGLVAEIRWSVADWSKQKEIEIKAGNYRSLVWKKYKAIVPIEKYKSAEELYVHFFSEGKVRAVSSKFGTEGSAHPVQRDDAKAATNAATGQLIDSMFTEVELAEIKRKNTEGEASKGNWK